ncbi:class I SAM-dependent methyltransferase [Desulforhopalus singaporensis]|uniref:Lysine methyltransferase n=1 Tax=Desulforhopalus singaporensis TaxID=91360 RepID=A0A1H0ND83_9BACT|nr:methyltransferase domain-containing protein [Desulforhopalus singaporensis]SDO90355.1 Lysine methyltransferase [Desulforhopalus singaporensis]
MDIRTLPELEREIYNRIRSKYKLTFDTLKAGEKKIRLLKIEDLEQFLDGKDPFADVSEFPFWIRLWDSAIILSYVLANQQRTEGKRLLELGAGLGAPGLMAAAAGFDVTLSDYEDIILDFQRVSAAASKLDNVHFCHLDWLNPPSLEPFDVLAGAEILFREEFFAPLLRVFDTSLKPDGTIMLAHDAKRQSLWKFLKLAGEEFDIALKEQNIKRDGKNITIIVNRLRRKKK